VKKVDVEFLVSVKGLEACTDEERLGVAKYLRRDFRSHASRADTFLQYARNAVQFFPQLAPDNAAWCKELGRIVRTVSASASSWVTNPHLPDEYREAFAVSAKELNNTAMALSNFALELADL
jgi:hypothetical protein